MMNSMDRNKHAIPNPQEQNDDLVEPDQNVKFSKKANNMLSNDEDVERKVR